MLEFLRKQLAALLERRAAAATARDAAIAAATAESRALTTEESAAFDARLAEVTQIDTDVTAMNARIAEVETQETRSAESARSLADAGLTGPDRGTPELMQKTKAVSDPYEVHNLGRMQARSQALAVIERAGKDDIVTAANQGYIERLMKRDAKSFNGDYIARRILLTENDHYRSAFVKKTMFGADAALTPEETRAVAAFQDFEYRAASEGTTTAGGFGIPVLIDSSIILTSGAADVPLLRISRIETITTKEWKGVSSGAPSWSFDTEGTAVSDDMTTLAQPNVITYTARGFIPYSVEVSMDYPNFAAEMQGLIEQGYIDLLAQKTAIGSGSTEPWGIFTAIDQTAASEVVSTTDGAFGGEDIFKVWNALPERARMRASWFMDVTHESKIRQFATGTNSMAYFTIDLSEGGISRINGRPVYLSDYAPAFSSTTGAANRVVVGDFRHYVVAQRAGMNLELVPMMFDVTNNMPTLQRGWLAWARVGADSVADQMFRLLQNQ